MMASRSYCHLSCPSQAELDAFRRAGIDILALASPSALRVATGDVAHDDLFEHSAPGERWFALKEFGADDVVFWHLPTGRLASWSGCVFALGEEIIDEAATYSFDCALNIFADPLDWLRAKRDGIVVLPNRWLAAFDRLRDCPRIAIAESLLPTYRRHMRPARIPELLVIPELRRAA
jgi:hypothetical protein